MKVIVTIDTEADRVWSRPNPVTVDNLRAMPRLQAVCDRYGIKPTYLCTYEAVRHDDFAPLARWQQDGRCEVGSHLHPWTTPPFSQAGATVVDETEYPGFPSELTIETFREKMRVLGALISERTGRAPTSYRAGRWGFSPEQIPVLLELGYIVDCSVTPLLNRRSDKGLRARGPDYRHAPVTPYRIALDDMCAPGGSALWEVPVTIVHTGRLMQESRLARWAWSRVRDVPGTGILERGLTLEPLWFRPYPHPRMNVEKLALVYRRARQLELPVIEMMFHSSELLAGASPSFPDDASIERAFEMLEATFAMLHADGCHGITLSDFARELEERTPSHS